MRQWKKSFEADNADDYANDYEDGLDEDDLDMFGGDDTVLKIWIWGKLKE
jgi:hypothetical protein